MRIGKLEITRWDLPFVFGWFRFRIRSFHALWCLDVGKNRIRWLKDENDGD